MSLLNRDETMKLLDLKDDEGATVDFLIGWITSRAESYIGRKLESQDFEWRLDGTGGNIIVLPACPIVSVTGIYLDYNRYFTTALDEDDYYCETETGIINLYRHTTPVGAKTVKVVASAGYTADTLPGDLKMAFISAIMHHYGKLINQSFGLSSQTSPDGMNVAYELELPSDTKRVFDSYKEVRV